MRYLISVLGFIHHGASFSTDFGGKEPCLAGLCSNSSVHDVERLLLTQEKTLGFLASGGEDFRPGPET